MKCYMVGGAVRDELLGAPVNDRDWVVVGATPQQMVEQGFVPVGKDFPVFLHPQTREEYALARTERKTAPGYHGFAFHTDPAVTLEEDLARRDLTINAMARGTDGELVDPFGGHRDLVAKVLRHVSPAFAEDPVRILRLARFAARFGDFRVAPETEALMRQMVEAGEVEGTALRQPEVPGVVEPRRGAEAADEADAEDRHDPEGGDGGGVHLLRAHLGGPPEARVRDSERGARGRVERDGARLVGGEIDGLRRSDRADRRGHRGMRRLRRGIDHVGLDGEVGRRERRVDLRHHVDDRRPTRGKELLRLRIPHLAFRITIRLRAKSRRELVLFACRIAVKATPERASKLPRVPRSVSAPCPGRTRKRSLPECRQPAP